jgi:restriction system protein
MAVPDFSSFLLPTLRAFADGLAKNRKDGREFVVRDLQLSDQDLSVFLRDQRTPVYSDRTNWALYYLHRAGALHRAQRGVYQITDRGRDLLSRCTERITVKDLMEFPEFREFQEAKKTNDGDPVGPVPPTDGVTPVERLQGAYEESRQTLAAELLDRVRQASPQFFEQLVLDLLTAMGYGGSIEDAAKNVGRTGDGGIDGVIKEDKLGLDVVYVQAKRWGDRMVSVGDVRDFSGALDAARARKGVFITTSRFTQDAREYVQKIEKKIVLIDGRQLAELMIDHDVGVTVVQTYKLKRVDSDYFESE